MASFKKTEQLLLQEDFEYLNFIATKSEELLEKCDNHEEALGIIDYIIRNRIRWTKEQIKQAEDSGLHSEAERLKVRLQYIYELYRIYYIEA